MVGKGTDTIPQYGTEKFETTEMLLFPILKLALLPSDILKVIALYIQDSALTNSLFTQNWFSGKPYSNDQEV